MKYIPSSSYTSKEAATAIPKMVQRRRTFHIFGFVATLMLVASLLSSIGVFLYKKELTQQLEKARADLRSVSTVDNEKKIAEVGAFDMQLRIADHLLNDHLAPSRIFTELETLAKKTVQFTDFKYSYDPGFEASLELGGKTDEFTSVALQKMKILEEKMYSPLIVHSISSTLKDPEDKTESDPLEDEGVSFGVKGTLVKELFAYTGENVTHASELSTDTSAQHEGVSVSDDTSTSTSNEIMQ